MSPPIELLSLGSGVIEICVVYNTVQYAETVGMIEWRSNMGGYEYMICCYGEERIA